MKVLIYCILILLICFSNIVLAEIYWIKTFGGPGFENGNSVQQTTDGGYIITGKKDYGGEESRYDVLLIKTDVYGNMQWYKTFGGAYDDCGYSVQQTTDSGYIITGVKDSINGSTSPWNVWLIKTDAFGNMLWDKTFGEDDKCDVGYSVKQTVPDNGYIITGEKEVGGAGNIKVWLIKTDENGNMLWDKTFGENYSSSWGNSVQQNSDIGYIITGYKSSNGLWLIKTDASGNEMWANTFGLGEGESVQQTTDSGYIIIGTQSYNNTRLIKTDENGYELWNKYFYGSYCKSGQQTEDGGYILCGYRNVDDILIKTDTSGNLQWDKTFIRGSCHAVQQTNDGGYIITGSNAGDVTLIYYKPNGINQASLSDINIFFVFIIILFLSNLLLSYKNNFSFDH